MPFQHQELPLGREGPPLLFVSVPVFFFFFPSLTFSVSPLLYPLHTKNTPTKTFVYYHLSPLGIIPDGSSFQPAFDL